jgi:hypothetical protein
MGRSTLASPPSILDHAVGGALMEPERAKPHADSFAAARDRRMDLKQAVSEVEMAIAAAADDPLWRATTLAALRRLRAAFDDHVAEVESSDGLLLDLTRDAPRLQLRIDRVSAEHPIIGEQIDTVLTMADQDAPIDDLREEALKTLLAIARHRQHGADLVYEAYHVDIGGG